MPGSHDVSEFQFPLFFQSASPSAVFGIGIRKIRCQTAVHRVPDDGHMEAQMTETLEVKRFEWYLPGDSSRDRFGMVKKRDPFKG